MADEQCIRDPYDYVQLRWILMPNYKENESIGVIKAHHCFGDGLAIAALLLAMNENPDFSQLVGYKPVTWWKQIIIWLVLPFNSLKTTVVCMLGSTDRNPIKRPNNPLTGKKHGAFNMDMSLPKIKAASKQLGCTVNDFIAAILSNTQYEYFERYKHQNPASNQGKMPDEFKIGMPFSFRQQPMDKVENIKVNNDYCALVLSIKIFKEFLPAVEHFKTYFKKIVKSFDPYGTYFTFALTVGSAYNLPDLLTRVAASKPTMVFSNVYTMKCRLEYKGIK